jgi:hypothetical protein
MDNRGQPIPVSDKSGSTPVDQSSDTEYVSIHDLANRIGYAEGTIRNSMSDGVFKLGEHYVNLGGHLKTGQSWTGQTRPVGEHPKHECSTPVARESASARVTRAG